MPSVILAVLDHPGAAAALLAGAQRLAEACGGARINALVVRAPPETLISPSEEVLTAEREARLRDMEGRRAVALQTAFDARVAMLPKGIAADWIDIDGIAELLVEERGRRSDYLVIEHPSRRDYGTSWHALRAALFATDRPVLVVPIHHAAEFGHRMAIAWRDDERATKAVLSALPFLRQAAKVFVLAGIRHGADAPSLPAILSEHSIAAELHALPIGSGQFGAALLHKAHELGADMMVMGAYQHSPIRELLLGGVTRFMLNSGNLPVLMRH
jgi:nucleotide-binding universal stress UspA family protein